MKSASLVLSGLLLLTPQLAWALSTDKNQPVIVDADTMELDFRTGERTYIGNVTIKQGSLVIRGDKVKTDYKDDELQNATVWGKPARFKQRPDGEEVDVTGRAARLFLDELRHRMFMYKNAVLEKGTAVVRSPEIQYDINTSKMIVRGGSGKTAPAKDTGGEKGTRPDGRAHITIQPRKKP
ncbi:MAG: lipopolysaccharide transport periplasmic protein LptA [Gammaproteobacteria bacterium]|nr:lipopolysaccharide transport periplasmic protein LptA [Gammaproteobacteria bacterium]